LDAESLMRVPGKPGEGILFSHRPLSPLGRSHSGVSDASLGSGRVLIG
jgi:hypothetical protein